MVHESGSIRLDLRNLGINKEKFIKIVQIGLPASLQGVIFSLSNVVIQSSVNSFGEITVAGNSAAANIEGFVYVAMNSLYQAAISFTGQNVGAGKYERVNRILYTAEACVIVVGLVLGNGALFFGKQLLSIYTENPDVIDAGMKRVGVMALAYCISAFMDCTIAASRALGKSLVPMFIVIMGSCVFRVVWVYTVFAYFKTIPSLYLLYVFSWTITAIAEIIYFLHVYRGIFPKANAVA